MYQLCCIAFGYAVVMLQLLFCCSCCCGSTFCCWHVTSEDTMPHSHGDQMYVSIYQCPSQLQRQQLFSAADVDIHCGADSRLVTNADIYFVK